jgi:acetate kinase
MKTANAYILTINGGSSSIKFAMYQGGEPLQRQLYGTVDRIGLPGGNLTFHDSIRNLQENRSIEASDHRSAAAFLIDWLEGKIGFASVTAVGHRVVHGMNYTEPQRVTQELADDCPRCVPAAVRGRPKGMPLMAPERDLPGPTGNPVASRRGYWQP